MHHALIFATSFLAALAHAAHAQCGTWSEGGACPSVIAPLQLPLSPFFYFNHRPIAALDLGQGVQLYGAANSTTAMQLARWDGRRWEDVGYGTNPGLVVASLWPIRWNGAPLLVASNSTTTYASGLRAYDGTSWQSLGALNVLVTDVVVHDDGSGETLFACGFVTSAPQTTRVLRWTGSAWLPVGADFAGSPAGLASYDSGSGPRLYSGVWTNSSSTVVRSWNGSTWSSLSTLPGSGRALATFNGTLYLGGMSFGSSGSAIRAFDGTSWSDVGPLAGGVGSLAIVDLGQGPRLLLYGSAVTGAGLPTASGLVLFDGTNFVAIPNGNAECVAAAPVDGQPRLFVGRPAISIGGVACQGLAYTDSAGNWETLGRGLDGAVLAFATHGGVLHAGGAFTAAGYAPLLRHAASWNGAGWTSTGANLSPTAEVRALCSADLGAGPELFAGGRPLQPDFVTGVVRFNGTSWNALPSNVGIDVTCLAAFDDGAGTRLFAGGSFDVTTGGFDHRIAAWNGTSWSSLAGGMDSNVRALACFDDGSGERLFAGGDFLHAGGQPAARIASWDGASWSPLAGGVAGGSVSALCVFAGELWAGGTFTSANGTPVNHLARWNGVTWSDVPGGGPNGGVLALHVHDDGRGSALYVGGGFSSIGGVAAYNIARFDGTSWEAVDGGTDGLVNTFASFDDDGDGDDELFAGGEFLSTERTASAFFARLEGCPHYASFCFGDGSLTDHTTPCPCGNNGAAGNGCAHSFGASGANLSASGATSTDTVVLHSQFEPASSFTLFLQQANQGDAVFHDGVLCAANPLVRLRGRAAVGGEAFFPNSNFAQDSTTSLSLRGGVTIASGVTRYYSAFYRNASTTFCPPATANVTNGVRVVW